MQLAQVLYERLIHTHQRPLESYRSLGAPAMISLISAILIVLEMLVMALAATPAASRPKLLVLKRICKIGMSNAIPLFGQAGL